MADHIIKADWNVQHAILASVAAADTPVVVALAANQLIGRVGSANIGALSAANVRTIINVADGADVTGANAPQAHNLAGAEHNADTLANLNSKVSDATLIDTGDSRLSDARTPTAHNLGGAEHSADTLANLNAKVSDATLDDSSDPRTPSAHTIASHSDTTATGAELEELTDGSETTLHSHAGGGGARGTVSAKSANYTITDGDGIEVILMTAGATDKTVTLPTAADNTNRVIEVFMVDSGVGNTVIDGEDAETIDGLATVTLVTQYEGLRVRCDGTSWKITFWYNRNTARASATLSGVQSVSAGAFEVVEFNSEIFDIYSEYTTSSPWTFTASEAGFYNIAVGAYFAAYADAKYIEIYIRKNAVSVVTATNTTSSSASYQTNYISTILELAKNDTIDFRAYNGDTVARNLAANNTRFSISKVG